MQEILIFLIGLVAGFLGATVGGGGMVAVPALILIGFSPQISITLNKFGDIGAFISALTIYSKNRKIDWKMAFPLMMISVVTSLIGSQLMLRMDASILEIILLVTIILAAPFIIFKKEIGLKSVEVSKNRKFLGYIFYVMIFILGAVIGTGTATLILIVMTYFFGYRIVEGYATNIPAALICSIIPTTVYALHGLLPILPALIIFIGMLLGGILGSKIALLKGDLWIKRMFIIILIALLVNIIIKYV